MAFAQAQAHFSSAAGTGPTGPKYVRRRRLQIDPDNGRDFREITETISMLKSDFVNIANAAEPDIPVNAMHLECLLIGAGGPGHSGIGYGGLPGVVKRFTIPFADLPDDIEGAPTHIEIGAPGLGAIGGPGYQGGSSSISYGIGGSNFIWAQGGLPGQGSQSVQRELGLWTAQNGITISDLGQNNWNTVYPVGPSSPSGPGAGAPNDFDNMMYGSGVYGGYGARDADRMYEFGDGGSAYGHGFDNRGGNASGYGAGGGAGDADYEGGSGGSGLFRYAIFVMETVDE